jgi:hypothetical protein
MAKPTSTPQNQAPAKLGVLDFSNFTNDTQPEWTLFAVKAPFEQVSKALADFCQPERWLRDVPRKPAADGDDMGFPLVAVVQIKNNPWTVVFREICYATEEGLEAIKEEAKFLSVELKTRAITLASEDTSGAIDYEIYDQGKEVESAQWESGGQFFSFKSTLRKKPSLESVDENFADEVFQGEGVYVPVCYPQSSDKDAWLCVEKVSAAAIERADLLDLGAELNEEDKDEGESEEEGEDE